MEVVAVPMRILTAGAAGLSCPRVGNSPQAAAAAAAYTVRGNRTSSVAVRKDGGPRRDTGMSRKRIVTAVVTVAVLFAALPAFAAAPGYFEGSATKLARGVVNSATGWLELPKQTVIGGQENGASGVVTGFVKGLGMTLGRTVAGGYETGTFWAPIPEGFEPVMEPATVFEDR